MKKNINQAQIVSHYWLDESTYLVCTDEFRIGPDWENDIHGVAWAEIWVDEGNSLHFGINVYSDADEFLDTLYEGDEAFIEFPDVLKNDMVRILEVAQGTKELKNAERELFS